MNKRIRALREHFGLSQTAFAARLNMTRSMISNMELGLVEIPEYRINAIVKEYGVNRRWLESGEGEMLVQREDDERATVEQLTQAYNGSGVFRALIDVFLHLDEQQRCILEDAIRRFAGALSQGEDPASALPTSEELARNAEALSGEDEDAAQIS